MRKLLMSAAVLVALTACNNKPAETNTPEASAPAPKSEFVDIKVAQLSTNVDPGCGMTVEDGSIADTATVDGKLYGFCSKECKADYLAKAQGSPKQ
ncbi:MAG: hypothetical protein U0T75_14880 [Chitinophagales bacterium]